MPETKSFLVRMDAEQLARLDAACGPVPRERFVRDALQAAVEAAARRQAALDKINSERLAALRERDQALRAAHLHGATVRQLAELVKLSPAAVSKAVRRVRM